MTSLAVQETQAYAGKTLQLYSKISSSQNLHPRCVVIQSSGSGTTVQLRSGDMSWDAFMQAVLSQPQQVLAFEPTRVGPETIMNILFSSGTTGAPKVIPWKHTTPFRCARSQFFLFLRT